MTGTDEKSKAAASPEPPRWAADEPTAMWSDDELREHGFDALASSESSASTTGDRRSDMVSPGQARVPGQYPPGHYPPGQYPPGQTPLQPEPRGLTWAATIAIAVVVAAVVYFAVRALR